MSVLPSYNIIIFNSIVPAFVLIVHPVAKMRSIKAVQSTNKDYNKMSRNSTQGLEPCMEQIGKAISLFSKCDAYLFCYVNTFWGCSHAWDVELLLTGIQAVYQRSFAACKDTIGLMCVSYM